MSTRSLTLLLDEHMDEIAVLYRHCDGYPEGHGAELVDFLKGKAVINGNGPKGTFNGAGCMAASIISHFKAEDEPGGFYLYAPGTRDMGEEYIYRVWVAEGRPAVSVAECHAHPYLVTQLL